MWSNHKFLEFGSKFIFRLSPPLLIYSISINSYFKVQTPHFPHSPFLSPLNPLLNFLSPLSLSSSFSTQKTRKKNPKKIMGGILLPDHGTHILFRRRPGSPIIFLLTLRYNFLKYLWISPFFALIFGFLLLLNYFFPISIFLFVSLPSSSSVHSLCFNSSSSSFLLFFGWKSVYLY